MTAEAEMPTEGVPTDRAIRQNPAPINRPDFAFLDSGLRLPAAGRPEWRWGG